MLLRNREARRALIACIVLTIAGSAVAYLGTVHIIEHAQTPSYLVATGVTEEDVASTFTLSSLAGNAAGVACPQHPRHGVTGHRCLHHYHPSSVP